MEAKLSTPSQGATGLIGRALALVERVGNRLPDPATLFLLIGFLVLVMSAIGSHFEWSVLDPRDGTTRIMVDNLLDAEGLRWVLTSMVRNFLDFPPLGIVLVAMLGIGVAERTGLFPALLKLLVATTPARFLTPMVIFIGVNSSAAADSGYVVLPPLAAGVFAMMGRSPVVGIAAATFGIAGGFSANVLITSLDPLLSTLTEQAAQLVDPSAKVSPAANYYFMLASTFLLTLLGWLVTARVVEPRFSKSEVAAQIAQGGLSIENTQSLTRAQWRGLVVAGVALVVVVGSYLTMALMQDGPLTGLVQPTGSLFPSPAWSEALIPLILLAFLLPGVAYGVVTGEIRSDRCVANRMSDSMGTMSTYIMLAFFGGQALAWFRHSNLAIVLGVEGADIVRSMDLSAGPLIVALVAVVAVLDLLLASASAKWAFLAPILVPILGSAGLNPAMVQAAYRVGDSCVNPIAPLNVYLIIVLVVIKRYQPTAGLGTLLALMLPYSISALVVWTAFLIAWNALGIPLGF